MIWQSTDRLAVLNNDAHFDIVGGVRRIGFRTAGAADDRPAQ